MKSRQLAYSGNLDDDPHRDQTILLVLTATIGWDEQNRVQLKVSLLAHRLLRDTLELWTTVTATENRLEHRVFSKFLSPAGVIVPSLRFRE